MNRKIEGLDVETYEIGESKKTLLFTHGWPGECSDFINLMMACHHELKDIQVVSASLPGFGKSQYPKGEKWNSNDYADWLDKLCHQVSPNQPVSLYAHSFSGRIALNLATKKPKRVEKLILSAAAGTQITKNNSINRFVMDTKDFVSKSVGLIRPDLDIKLSSFLSEKTPDLSKIKQETLILWGEKDNVIPLKAGKILNNRIPNSQLKIIDGAGHNIHKTNKLEISKAIAEFL